MYGSCGVRYFRIDDDFSYDTEFAEYDGAAYDQAAYDGFTFDNRNELCYDINVENNLIGPQVGWTTNYCVGCRWNFFCNSTFGVFDNHMTKYQRVWTGGDGRALHRHRRIVQRSQQEGRRRVPRRIARRRFVRLHLPLARRAGLPGGGLTGIATSIGQIPDHFAIVMTWPRSIRTTR